MYIISVKARKDISGNKCEQWMYAGIDDGAHGTGYPCWCYSDCHRKSFSTIEDAEEWFNNSKSVLLGSYYKNNDFDMITLGIRKVIYKKVGAL